MLLESFGSKKLSQNTIQFDIFDADTYQELRSDSSQLQLMEKSGQERLKTFDRLLQDIYCSLYKAVPKLFNEDEIDKGYFFNRCQMEKFMDTSQYNELRGYTELDTTNSAMGALTVAGELIKEYQEDRDLRKIMREFNRASDALNAAHGLSISACNNEELAKAAQQTGDTLKADEFNKMATDAKVKQQELEERAESLIKSANMLMGQNQVKMRQALRKAGEAASYGLQAVDDVVSGWGIGGESLERLPMDRKIELLNKMANSNKFKKLAEVMGRYRNLSRTKQKEKLRNVQSEIHSVTVGNNLGRILPSELIMLNHPVFNREFYRKFTAKQLYEYELKGKEKVGKGPIVVLIDSSGSTAGRTEEFIKGTAMGLLDIAVKEKRPFAVVFFASSTAPMKLIEFVVGERDPEKIYELGTYFINGGTDFEKPLDKAVELIDKSVYNKADIVMLTDGECDISADWLKTFLNKKKEKDFKVFTILMNVGRTTGATVQKFSDRVELIGNVLEDVAAEVFGSI